MSRFTQNFLQGSGTNSSNSDNSNTISYSNQDKLRIRDAKKAVKQQKKDEKNGDATPKAHLKKVRGIREQELARQLNQQGGTSKVMKRIS